MKQNMRVIVLSSAVLSLTPILSYAQGGGAGPSVIPSRSGVVEVDPFTAGMGEGRFPVPRRQGRAVGETVVVNQDVGVSPQNETTIAIDPRNARRLAAGSNDYRNGDSGCGMYGSTDGGQTWHDISGGIQPVPFPAGGDPAIAFDANGTAYFVCLSFNRNTNFSALVIARSTDLQTIEPRGTIVESSDSNVFHDKEFVAIDTRPSSPYFGRIYVSWTRFDPSGSPIVLSHSDDGGATWSNPVQVNGGFNQGSYPAVGPKGEVYVAFENFSPPRRIMVATSLDGGNSFTQQVVDQVTPVCPRINPDGRCALLNSNFRVNNFPSIAVNNRSGSIHVVWADYRAGNADILYSESRDRGASFRPAIKVNDDTGTADQIFPWVAVAGDASIWVAYYDRRDDPDNRLMMTYVSMKRPNQRAFGPALRASTDFIDGNVGFGGTFIGDYIGVAAGPNFGHPIWASTFRNQQDAASARVFLKH